MGTRISVVETSRGLLASLVRDARTRAGMWPRSGVTRRAGGQIIDPRQDGCLATSPSRGKLAGPAPACHKSISRENLKGGCAEANRASDWPYVAGNTRGL